MKNQTLKFSTVLAISRPKYWLYTLIPFATSYLLMTGKVSLDFWLGSAFFLFSFNLLLRGINIIYARFTPKQINYSHSTRRNLWLWIVLANMPFIAYFIIAGSISIKISIIVIIGLVIIFNVKGLRLREIPILDAVCASLILISPFIFGLILAESNNLFWPVILAFFLWGFASYSFGSIHSIQADRTHNKKSIASYLGAKQTASISFWLYLVSAVIIATFYGFLGIAIAILLSIYALNVSFFRKFKSDGQSRKYQRGWSNFLWLNYIIGFWTMLMLVIAFDIFRLSGVNISIIVSLLISFSLIEALMILHNLISFTRPKVNRLAEWPKVSILIHAHNQADNIASTILALIGQNYPEYEIIFTDLDSSDNTLKIVAGYEDPRIQIVKIAPLAKGWTINAHATAELMKHATGELVILLSADTVLKPNALSIIASTIHQRKLDLISLLPADQNKTIAQKLILSQNQFFLLGVYPAAYLSKNLPKYASAYSGLMVFDRQKINSLGGFELVKNSPLEDMDIAIKAKLGGLKTGFYIGSDIAISQNHADLKLILNQNIRRFYPTLRFNMPLAISLITGGFFLFCTPLLLLIYQVFYHNAEFTSGLLIVSLIGLANRLVVALVTRQSLISCVLYPLTSAIALVEVFISLLNYELLKPRWLNRTEAL